MAEIRSNVGEIKDMLRDSRVVHAKHSHRLEAIEKWRDHNDRWGWKQSLSRELVGLAFDAVKWIAIIAYAAHLAQMRGLLE